MRCKMVAYPNAVEHITIWVNPHLQQCFKAIPSLDKKVKEEKGSWYLHISWVGLCCGISRPFHFWKLAISNFYLKLDYEQSLNSVKTTNF